MSMPEVIARKAAIDAAVAAHEAAPFTEHFLAWLEATAYLRTLPNLRKLGFEPGPILPFGAVDLRDVSVRKEADDAVMAFCIAAGLARDKEAFVALDRSLTERFGIIYPGSSALYHCNQLIDPIVTLDDAVGQILKALFESADFAPKQLWHAGLRLLQRLRSSNFDKALTPLVAGWLHAEWARALAAPSRLHDPDIHSAGIEARLEDVKRDQPFIVALLFASAGAADPEIAPDYLAQLAKLAQRV